jgi:hypothetical protein
MLRQLASIATGLIVAASLLTGHASAQFYLPPTSYQPMPFFQPSAHQLAYQNTAEELPSPRGMLTSQLAPSIAPSADADTDSLEAATPADATFAPEAATSAEASATAGHIPPCKHPIHILNFPGILEKSKCCPNCLTGNCDHDLKRFPTKQAALAAGCDPECIVCVKEPFVCQVTVWECAEVVFFRCYQRSCPFKDKHCEDQRCIEEVGKRTVKKLEPCTVNVKFPCKKTIIDYRDVWICIKCDCHHPHPSAEIAPTAGY